MPLGTPSTGDHRFERGRRPADDRCWADDHFQRGDLQLPGTARGARKVRGSLQEHKRYRGFASALSARWPCDGETASWDVCLCVMGLAIEDPLPGTRPTRNQTPLL